MEHLAHLEQVLPVAEDRDRQLEGLLTGNRTGDVRRSGWSRVSVGGRRHTGNPSDGNESGSEPTARPVSAHDERLLTTCC